MSYGTRFPRTEREAFQALANPVLTPRRSQLAGEFRMSLAERIRRFLRAWFR